MIGAMLELTGKLELRSPLHLGSGHVGTSLGLTADSRRSRGDPIEVALVAMDVENQPVIPGSTLKGALRAAFGEDDETQVLFGPETIRDPDDARAGRLVFWAARRISEAPATDHLLPFAETPRAVREGLPAANESHGACGLYIETRAAIDRGRGTAAENRLFHRQMAIPGAQFGLRVGIEIGRGEDIDGALSALARVVRILRDGVGLGAGSNADQGRVVLLESDLRVEHLQLDGRTEIVTSRLGEKPGEAKPSARRVLKRYKLTLTCQGPFLVNNASETRRARVREEGAESDAQLKALRGFGEAENLPRLPGASLIGALRARAVWCGRLWHEGFEDDRDRIFAKVQEGEAPPETRDEELAWRIDRLSRTERLFGVNGWRGLIAVRGIRCVRHDGWQSFSSVKLDRFSGAPIDGGLFSMEASVNPVFEATLTVMARGMAPFETDLSFLERVLADLMENGLCLGHGASRGFGWFDVGFTEMPTEGT